MSYDTNPYVLLCRGMEFVNTDPQRRCYNGCYFSYEHRWGAWEELDRPATLEIAERRLKFWRELNDYAVSQRGEGARKEFKIVERQEEAA